MPKLSPGLIEYLPRPAVDPDDDIVLDLTGMDLRGANLSGCQWSEVNLSGADLSGADLSGARFEYVRLVGTYLNGAKLNELVAKNTDFSRVEIRSRRWLARGLLRRVWGGIAWGINWKTVRAVGNLQILTKASYLMLVVVPVLAALWPQVRHWYTERALETSKQADELHRRATDEHNQAEALRATLAAQAVLDAVPPTGDPGGSHTAVQAAAERVKAIAERNEKLAAAIAKVDKLLAERKSLPELKRAFEDLRSSLHPPDTPNSLEARAQDHARRAAETRKRAEVLQKSVGDLWLPWVYVYAFAAAVCVIVGHFVYQTAAPVMVREQKVEQFAEERWSRTIINNVVQQDEIVRALQSLRELAEDRSDTQHPQLVFRHGRVVVFSESPDLYKLSDQTQSPTLRPLIDEGAKSEYEREQYEGYIWAWVSLGLYALGAFFIMRGVYIQCVSIAHARGYETLGELLLGCFGYG